MTRLDDKWTDDVLERNTEAVVRANDMINRPRHYTWHPVAECKDIVGEFNYNLGTALTYIWRAPYKHDCPIEDLKKAIKHLEFECARLEQRRTQPR